MSVINNTDKSWHNFLLTFFRQIFENFLEKTDFAEIIIFHMEKRLKSESSDQKMQEVWGGESWSYRLGTKKRIEKILRKYQFIEDKMKSKERKKWAKN